MTLLITGGAGFIGTNFVRYWQKHYPQERIIILDALTYAGNYQNIADLVCDNLLFIKGCITDSDLVLNVLNQYQVSKVIHFAAESHVDRSILEPDIFIKTNILGTHTLLKAVLSVMAAKNNKIHFHHISTDEVYGSLNESDPEFTELSRFEPNSPYSASKAASDHFVRAYNVTYGLPITISHCSNNYGPFQNQEKMIPLIINNILEGLPLPIYGNGQNIRDWLYVEDHCVAIDKILSKGKIGETYNIGGGTEINNLDLVHNICTLIEQIFIENSDFKKIFPKAPCSTSKKNKNLITFVTDRKGHDFRYAINGSKIKNKLGFFATYSLEDGLKNTIQWFIEQKIKEKVSKDAIEMTNATMEKI